MLILRLSALFECQKRLRSVLFGLLTVNTVIEICLVGLSIPVLQCTQHAPSLDHPCILTIPPSISTDQMDNRLSHTRLEVIRLGVLGGTNVHGKHSILPCRSQDDRTRDASRLIQVQPVVRVASRRLAVLRRHLDVLAAQPDSLDHCAGTWSSHDYTLLDAPADRSIANDALSASIVCPMLLTVALLSSGYIASQDRTYHTIDHRIANACMLFYVRILVRNIALTSSLAQCIRGS